MSTRSASCFFFCINVNDIFAGHDPYGPYGGSGGGGWGGHHEFALHGGHGGFGAHQGLHQR